MKTLHNKFCNYCKTTKPVSEFYQKKGKEVKKKTRYLSYCKPCTNAQRLVRHQEFKKKCVEYKGGECEICGYSKYIGALEFHHKDRTKKDLQISKVRGKTFNDKIKEELDKCQLLCANCHREAHGINNKTYERK